MLLHHLLIIPILAPLLIGALQLFLTERRGVRVACALGSVLVQAGAALTLLYLTTDSMPDMWTEGVGVYAIGSWPAPFGIVLVVDRLAALMLVLTSMVGLAALVYSLAYWDRVAPAFHSLFQFLLMGLNGAFLTGDLFNLFVFFEVLLASSYGLLLHGSGVRRVKASLHYVAVNLVASFLFLIGVAMIYGMTGTLNMADLAGRITHARTGRSRALRGGRGDPRRRLSDQGRRMAAQLLVAGDLCGRELADRGGVLAHDQGWRVCGAARWDTARCRQRANLIHRCRPVLWRRRYDRLRGRRDARHRISSGES